MIQWNRSFHILGLGDFSFPLQMKEDREHHWISPGIVFQSNKSLYILGLEDFSFTPLPPPLPPLEKGAQVDV